MSYSYVALDVETANEFQGSISSIGLVRFEDGTITDTFYTLINPEEKFNNINISIHGIRPEDVLNSPTFPEVREAIIKFIGSDIVVAHFAQFDMGALKEVYIKYGLDFDDIEYICSYWLAKVSFPGQLNYKLNTLANHLNIELNHHDALSDARASGLILDYLLSSHSFSNLEDFLKEYRYDNTGLLGRHGYTRKKKRRYRK